MNRAIVQTSSARQAKLTSRLARAILRDDPDRVRALLAQGLSSDAQVWDWDSALFVAVKLRRARVVEALLAAGASPEPSPTGRVPLAAAAERGSLPLVDALLLHGARTDHAPDDYYDFTALEFGVLHDRPDIVARLCLAGADPNRAIRRCFDRQSWPHSLPPGKTWSEMLYERRNWKRLWRMPERKEQPLPAGRLIKNVPLLLVAVAIGADDVARALLAHRADQSATDSDGYGWDDYQQAIAKGRVQAPAVQGS